jgi:multidrug efflux pump subunit AcrA (membrane-fusion protein)
MTLVSRFDGTIRKVDAAVGEVSDPQKPSITVVSNDPLWVETKLPISVTADLKMGQSLQVRYLGEDKWREAKIIFFDPIADATIEGGAQLVHLELPNPEGRRAGQSMAVKLPQNVAAAK